MIFRTGNSIYELREQDHRFRRLGDGDTADGPWQRYEWASPIEEGEPVLIYLPSDGPAARPRALTTSPVEAILTPV